MTTVLITGANGFVGKTLCKTLQASELYVKAAVRSEQAAKKVSANKVSVVGLINSQTQWQEALMDVDVVVHLAARVHVMQENHNDPVSAFSNVNLKGTENLAQQAVAHGVKRFIYLSSIKVNGEQTQNTFFTAEDKVNPEDPYAVSKWQAEMALNKISTETGLEVVIIRPPLIYGPNVKGNFLRLIKLIQKGWPTPFGRVRNKRSMVSLDNLCDLIKICVQHPAAKGEVFLVSDQHDLATAELIRLIALYCNKSARQVPVPVALLRTVAAMIGKGSEIDRLCGSLQIDMNKTQQLLAWHPPFSVQDGIQKTIESYIASYMLNN